ncbi:hypothetical protein [Agrobacterium tumefaciens]|uniref:hypothetical protein n=1 Tax=Agrobacterium tumefaciens TaxID=358 RepID=UPI001574D2B7|nr:hypothetical protein [Agrobacterium tumefaciens]NTB05940.1 hypothetical protein [Agrobacterium tumefaciens]
MRNRILSLTRSTIPYVKEIMPLAGSVTGCILMQQLDYWFERYPEGFYKFQDAAPGHPMYREGESWTEELGFTLSEFRGAFDRIGVRHKSKSDWQASADQFDGKFYCCYTDRRAGLTFYYRNHAKVDAALDTLVSTQARPVTPQPGPAGAQNTVKPALKPPVLPQKNEKNTGNQKTVSPVNEKTSFPANPLSSSAANAESSSPGMEVFSSPEVGKDQALEVGKVHAAYTETTLCPENNQKLQPQMGAQVSDDLEDQRGGGIRLEGLETLIYPKGLPIETEALVKLMVECPPAHRQAILDEAEGARLQNTLRVGIVPFARGLLKAVAEGRFTPSAGVSVAASRAAAAVQRQVVESAHNRTEVRAAEDMSDEEIAALPSAVMRERMMKLKLAAQQVSGSTH